MNRVALIVLDGAGYSKELSGNVVTPEYMPNLFAAMESFGHAVLEASGEAVGLEPGQVGNSEAGHLTIGAGTRVPSLSVRIEEEYRNGSWAGHALWGEVRGQTLHVVGLLSSAGVHGFARTLAQSAELGLASGANEVIVHPVLDGVDSPRATAPALLATLQTDLAAVDRARLGVIMGREWFCDRSGNAELTRTAVEALRQGAALPVFSEQALARHLATGAAESSLPAHLCAGGRGVRPGELVLHTAHRADRARQIVAALTAEHDVLTLVDTGVTGARPFFPQQSLSRGLATELLRHGVAATRIAEKCKFPHVTYFMDGFVSERPGERRCIPSLAEHEIAERPEMSLAEVTAEVTAAMARAKERFIIANLANLDQVGHLGDLACAARAAAVVDEAFARLVEAASQHGWTLVVTADHGNADCVEKDGASFGAHTDRPVPLVVVPAGTTFTWSRRTGTLANVAATCLTAAGLEVPAWMAPSLVGG